MVEIKSYSLQVQNSQGGPFQCRILKMVISALLQSLVWYSSYQFI